VKTVRVLGAPARVGVTDEGLNEHEAPAGRVAATQDKVTGMAVPALNVAVIVTVLELPAVILTGPLFDSE
jgi:hypothetical protein